MQSPFVAQASPILENRHSLSPSQRSVVQSSLRPHASPALLITQMPDSHFCVRQSVVQVQADPTPTS